MLAKPQRLARDKDFEKIFKQGKSFFSKLLGVKIILNQRTVNRYGIIVSSKVSKKAVDRNLLKRQVREAIKRLDSKMAQGIDLAIVVLPAMLGSDFKIIRSELENVFAKLKLFK